MAMIYRNINQSKEGEQDLLCVLILYCFNLQLLLMEDLLETLVVN